MRLFLSILLFTVHWSIYSQNFSEKIISNTNSNSCFGVVELEGDLFFSFSSEDVYFGSNQRSIIYHSDASLNLIDSVDLSNHNGSIEFSINNFKKTSDSTFWVIGNASYNQPNPSTAHAILFDKSLNIINEYTKHSTLDSVAWGLTLAVVDSFTILGGYQFDQGLHPGYWVWDKTGTLVFSNVLDTVTTGVISDLKNYNGRLFFGLANMPFHSRGEINTLDYTVKRIVKEDWSVNGGALFINGFIDPSFSAGNILGYGQLGLQTLALVKMDTNLNQIAIDTFSTIQGKSTKVDRGMLDASAVDQVYFITAEDPLFTASNLQSGLMNKMKLWRVDTGGNMIWSVLINDSSYYLPTKTVATSDGGALFFSMKYDWRIDPSPKTALSIIKLDSNGNFVALHEKEFSYQKPVNFSIYPNPVKTNFNISGIESAKTAAILIYNIDGTMLKEISNPSSTVFDVSDITPGTYLLRVLYKDGRQGMTKVVKVD